MTNDGNAILREVTLHLIGYFLMQEHGLNVCLENEMSTLNHLLLNGLLCFKLQRCRLLNTEVQGHVSQDKNKVNIDYNRG